jgi:hypothetical protein
MNSIEAIEGAISSIATLHSAGQVLDKAAVVLRLRRIFPTIDRTTLALAIDTYFLRQTAIEKLGSWAARGFFSAELLEQASRQAISVYRASLYQGLHHVLELGTGTGSDTAALARVVERVTTIEVDPVRAELAKENLRVQGISNVTFLIGDVLETVKSLEVSAFDGLFADPARRTRQGSRVRHGKEYSPPLDFLLNLAIGRVRAIKVSPGLFFEPPSTEWRRHFIGTGDECLEQTLVFGSAISDSSVHLADRMVGWQPGEAAAGTILPPVTILRGYIYEAHAVINRSQYLASFLGERGINLIAPDVAYGVSTEPPTPSPFLHSFRIIDAFPFTLTRLRQALQSLQWTNRTELKKRNCSLELDAIRTSLKLPPHRHNAPFGTVFLFSWRGSKQVVLGERLGE